jgi:outer membrane protein W
MKKIVLLFLFFVQFSSFGQEINPRNEFKNGLGLKLGGPTRILALNYNHFFTQNINLELGVGFTFGAYAGVKYYFGSADKVMKFAPYVGAQLFKTVLSNDDAIIPFSMPFGVYLPVGVQLFSKDGFNISLEASYLLLFVADGSRPGGSFHIGKNF